jgi:hypothetical protein
VDQHAAQARVGTTLRGKWRLDRLLGVGGMAAVYAATHRNASRGAVKMLHPGLSRNAEVRRRFLQEGYAANKVGHTGTVRCLDDDEAEDGSAFVVMELLDGETLEQRRVAAGGRLPAEEVLWIADQLLDVLAAAHEAGIIHRDLKPENLFLTHQGHLKVLDFGIAKIQGAMSTATGATMGTPAFMAPEQARGESATPATDLWAVGATLHHLLTAQYAHVATTLPELLAALCSREPPPLTTRWPEAPPALVSVLGGALRLDPAQRWANARQMQDAVRAAYLDLTGQALATAARPVPLAFDRTHLSEPPPRNERPEGATEGSSGGVTGRATMGATEGAPEGATVGAIAASSVRRPAPAAGRRGWVLGGGLLAVIGGAGWMLRPTPSALPPANTAASALSGAAPPSSSVASARLRIRAASHCTVTVDGTDAGEVGARMELAVSPGRHEVRCGAETQSVDLGQGETLVVSFRGAPSPPPTGSATPAPAPTQPPKNPPASKPAPKTPDPMDRRED